MIGFVIDETLLYPFSFQYAFETMPVKALGHDQWYVFRRSIKDHNKTDIKWIPEEEQRRKKHNNPVRKFRSAGFSEKGGQIIRICITKVFLWKTSVFKHARTIGKIFLPFSNSEDILINMPLFFPGPSPAERAEGIESIDGHPEDNGNDSHVNDKPGDNVDNNGP
ncbi:MAG: hypothetical protein R6U50_01645 [Desulfobacterales bacterium]